MFVCAIRKEGVDVVAVVVMVVHHTTSHDSLLNSLGSSQGHF